MPNRLAGQTSPYLLQHQHNPVDWFPWCDEALERARAEDKPIFLSIGYSACHWCHVMERESFEDPHIAALLNEHFIPIKVDREERPDLDQLYMTAVQAMTGRGGWPLSVFLTPDLKPFYGGTYWPPRARLGLPGFEEILIRVHEAWHKRREVAQRVASELAEHIERAESERADKPHELGIDAWHHAAEAIGAAYDPTYGGFGGAPKFPHAMIIEFLLRDAVRTGRAQSQEMAVHTLDAMQRGGIYDHVGGGFARYSVDARWHVPHFEKMLYDNALLAHAYLVAWQVTGREDFLQTTCQTLDYLLRDLRVPEGAFAASEDADSEGVEGKFYVWSWEELGDVFGAERSDVAATLGCRPEGNWEGTNVLHLPAPVSKLARQRGMTEAALRRWLRDRLDRLAERRQERVRPARDDKVLAFWNALAVGALAETARATGHRVYLDAATEAAAFAKAELIDDSGQLWHSWCRGQRSVSAFADDYAAWVDAAIRLHQATGCATWLALAEALARQLHDAFFDAQTGRLYYTRGDEPARWMRTTSTVDSSVPSATALAATAFFRLALLTQESLWHDAAARCLRDVGPLVARAPLAAGQALIALDWRLGPAFRAELSAASDDPAWQKLWECNRHRFFPRCLFAWQVPADPTAKPAASAEEAAPTDGLLELTPCTPTHCEPVCRGKEAIERWLHGVSFRPRPESTGRQPGPAGSQTGSAEPDQAGPS